MEKGAKGRRAVTTIQVRDASINIVGAGQEEYISLTDMAKAFGDDNLIYSWMRNRNTVEFLGIWEVIHNPDFKGLEFETFKTQAGLNSFHLTPRKWIETTGAIGITSRAGRTAGGTYAHKDIAFEFATWLSPEFKLYLIKEVQRLSELEATRRSEAWQLNRALSKLNYKIHTSAVKAHLIPAAVTSKQAAITYANEADILNVAVFGMTAKEWRDKNPGASGNMRDDASIPHLLVLSNLESLNATYIQMGMNQAQRLRLLNEQAISQLSSLETDTRIMKLPGAKQPDKE